jgi:hypothetical protein
MPNEMNSLFPDTEISVPRSRPTLSNRPNSGGNFRAPPPPTLSEGERFCFRKVVFQEFRTTRRFHNNRQASCNTPLAETFRIAVLSLYLAKLNFQKQTHVIITDKGTGFCKIWYLILLRTVSCRSQWPRGQRHEPSSSAPTLWPWVRIPLEIWMPMWVYSVFVLFCV